MTDDRRHNRALARKRWERSIAAEVAAEREQRRDVALLLRRHRGNPMYARWVS